MPSNRSSLITIPREVKAQENEIESLYRRLLRNSCSRQRQSDFTQRREGAAWVFIVLVGILSVFALYILYLKII